MTQQPSMGVLVFLRVLFVVISVCSIGFLAWTMLLRLAIVTRKGLDWGLFVATAAIDILAMVLIVTEPGEEIHTPAGFTGMFLLLGTLIAGVAYYLAAEIRHFHQLRYPYPPTPAPAPGPAPAYGYPQPQPPYTTTTVSHMPPAQNPPHTPVPRPGGGPHTPPPAPGPVPSAQPPQQPPARIDQVRAELDELSDYLRNQDGRPGNGG
ncbi:hypothetical protein AB0D49_17580 [Streptomyces sp. NPDC048290]|uniref:hypothetical protein n=1 Tax=Streptomyces sp. NPDC048290 TaxID=3155811 RepID=UPI003449DE5A